MPAPADAVRALAEEMAAAVMDVLGAGARPDDALVARMHGRAARFLERADPLDWRTARFPFRSRRLAPVPTVTAWAAGRGVIHAARPHPPAHLLRYGDDPRDVAMTLDSRPLVLQAQQWGYRSGLSAVQVGRALAMGDDLALGRWVADGVAKAHSEVAAGLARDGLAAEVDPAHGPVHHEVVIYSSAVAWPAIPGVTTPNDQPGGIPA